MGLSYWMTLEKSLHLSGSQFFSLVIRGAYLDASNIPSSVCHWTKLSSPTVHLIPLLPWHHQLLAHHLFFHLSSSTPISKIPLLCLQRPFLTAATPLHVTTEVVSFLLILSIPRVYVNRQELSAGGLGKVEQHQFHASYCIHEITFFSWMFNDTQMHQVDLSSTDITS